MLIRQGWDGSVPHRDEIVAKRGELPMLAGAKALAQADKYQQRPHTPGDAEHSEKCPELVGHHGPEDLRESVRKALHMYLDTDFGVFVIHTLEFPNKFPEPPGFNLRRGMRVTARCWHRLTIEFNFQTTLNRRPVSERMLRIKGALWPRRAKAKNSGSG
jgi:hypothetical protein